MKRVTACLFAVIVLTVHSFHFYPRSKLCGQINFVKSRGCTSRPSIGLAASGQGTSWTLFRQPTWATWLKKPVEKVNIAAISQKLSRTVEEVASKSGWTTSTLQFLQRFLPKLKPIQSLVKATLSPQLWLAAMFQLCYHKMFLSLHQLQGLVWRFFQLQPPAPFENSVIGFLDKHSKLLARLMAINYVVFISCQLLSRVLTSMPSFAPRMIATLSYLVFAAHVVDQFQVQFLPIYAPKISKSRRQSYMVTRATSVFVWFIAGLVSVDVVANFFKTPVKSILTFGGVGGLALGISARDIIANFFGGMMLLFNEPFTPGDMICFSSGTGSYMGRVENVGYGQVTLRGTDTRPTYIPNSQFVSIPVTNMDRITHRKYEVSVGLRYLDAENLPEFIAALRQKLKQLPHLDYLSQPFRVHFTAIGDNNLRVEILCYFATKSLDEFLDLQQLANIAVMQCTKQYGVQLALPTIMQYVPSTSGLNINTVRSDIVGGNGNTTTTSQVNGNHSSTSLVAGSASTAPTTLGERRPTNSTSGTISLPPTMKPS